MKLATKKIRFLLHKGELMWIQFLRFQFLLQLRLPLFWGVVIANFVLAFAEMSSDRADVFPFFNELVYRNSPISIVRFHYLLSGFFLLLVPLFFAAPVLRDTEQKTADILFPMPFRNRDYVVGYFLSGVIVCSCAAFATSIGIALGLAMPWLDQARIGPMTVWPFVWDFLVIRLPRFYFLGAVSILVAVKSRSITVVYGFWMMFFVLSGGAFKFLPDSGTVGDVLRVLHPLGRNSFQHAIEKFSVPELNTKLPSLTGELLANRVLYFFVTLGLLYCAIRFFNREQISTASKNSWFKKIKLRRLESPITGQAKDQTDSFSVSLGARDIKTSFSFKTELQQVWSIFKLETKMLMWNKAFSGMALVMSLVIYAYLGRNGEMYGLDLYPTTAVMLDSLNTMLNPVLLLLATFLAGELVFRERQHKLAEFVDAFPFNNWTVFTSKLFALFSVIIAVLLFCGMSILVRQIRDDEVSIEISVLFRGLIVVGIPAMFFAMFAFVLQVFLNNKYLAYLGMVILVSLNGLLEYLGFSHQLYLFGKMPRLQYSDLNAYGHYLIAWLWYAIYWAALCLVLIIIANAFWVRGNASGKRLKWSLAIFNIRKPASLTVLFFICAFVGIGNWIYYNTNVLNQSPSVTVMDALQARYESLYRQYAGLPHPKLRGVFARVDLYPEERRVHIEGRFTLKNQTQKPLQLLQIQEPTAATTTWMNLPPHEVVAYEKQFGFRLLKLNEALQPGDSMILDFSVQAQNKGFTNDGASTGLDLVGSFFSSNDFFPHFSYSERFELQDPKKRRKHGLGEKTRMPVLEDELAWETNLVDEAADWIDFETIISTSVDQFGISSGNLKKRWIENGRQYAHYKMSRPMMPYFSYLSGHWLVKQDHWNGLPIEIFYDRKHDFNIDRMASTVKRALDYYSSEFGPYPYEQLRIVEFPRYRTVAQSFANTIPYSESMGFTADLRNRDNIDFVTFVTAHEVAHQWWGHQFPVAKVQGANLLVESLAEYSALMVMEKKYGIEKIQRYLGYEMDAYFGSRKSEKSYERPLSRVEGQQYLAYTKGGLAFYRLRHELGEEVLNGALKRFLENQLVRKIPYAMSSDLLKVIRTVTPAEKQGLITDLFEKTIHYDNRVISARAKLNSDKKWEVAVEIELAKIETDRNGAETEIAYDEPLEIGIFLNKSKTVTKVNRALNSENRRVFEKKTTLKFTINDKPRTVWLDPTGILVERNRTDNRKLIEFN